MLCVCSPEALCVVFLGDRDSSCNWPRNSPSCSSARSVLTLRDKYPGFISGRLTSPDSSRLRATSAKHISCKTDNVPDKHSKTNVDFHKKMRTYQLTAFEDFTAELSNREVPRKPVIKIKAFIIFVQKGSVANRKTKNCE